MREAAIQFKWHDRILSYDLKSTQLDGEKLEQLVEAAVNQGIDCILLDEIQEIPQFERVLYKIQNHPFAWKCQLIVAGSQSGFIHRELGSFLVDRCIPFYMQPFSFSEFEEYLI